MQNSLPSRGLLGLIEGVNIRNSNMLVASDFLFISLVVFNYLAIVKNTFMVMESMSFCDIKKELNPGKIILKIILGQYHYDVIF